MQASSTSWHTYSSQVHAFSWSIPSQSQGACWASGQNWPRWESLLPIFRMKKIFSEERRPHPHFPAHVAPPTLPSMLLHPCSSSTVQSKKTPGSMSPLSHLCPMTLRLSLSTYRNPQTGSERDGGDTEQGFNISTGEKTCFQILHLPPVSQPGDCSVL